MTYEYTLADKMKKQFHGRGAALSGMQASSTSELVRRAGMGRDPRVNCSEQAFRERYGNGQNRVQREYSRNDAVKTNAYAGEPRQNVAGAQNNRKSTYADRNAKNNRNTHSVKNAAGQQKRDVWEGFEPITPSLEIPVRRRTIPPVFIAMLLVSTFMIMFLVMSISEIYETTNEIATLENEIATLKADAEELKLQLEEKNDIKLIEEIATTQLGMTKEDSLQRRYVSLSEGERIDVIEAETEEETGGVLLSSIFSAIGDFFGGKD